MAIFASLATVKLPDKDLDSQPTIFDSYDMSPVLFGMGKCARNSWFTPLKMIFASSDPNRKLQNGI
jgi:hypothetical protein